MTKTKTRGWDVVAHLETAEDMAAYLEAAQEVRLAPANRIAIPAHSPVAAVQVRRKAGQVRSQSSAREVSSQA
jgi:hypothetical protein